MATNPVKITDTILRDAHQSLLATRMSTGDMLPVADKLEAQAKTENGKKPDFLFPSQAAYEDPAFPEEQLRMLASKTSIKDRFRQVADEANRIRDKHLFTLTPGDVTHPKLAQLDELHIHLVMPKVVKESYDDLIQGETMTFSRFIEEIQGLQADRPQSLTLL